MSSIIKRFDFWLLGSHPVVLRDHSWLSTHSRITPGDARETIWDVRDQTQAGRLQDKRSTHCIIAPAPTTVFSNLSFFSKIKTLFWWWGTLHYPYCPQILCFKTNTHASYICTYIYCLICLLESHLHMAGVGRDFILFSLAYSRH